MKNLLSSRAKNIKASPTFALDAVVKLLESKGQKIINFGLGEPDFDTPSDIKKKAIRSIKQNFTHYTAIPGIMELRQQIAYKLKHENSVVYSPLEILVGTGAKQVLYNAFQALLDNGQEVLIPTPTWSSYLEQVKLSGGKPVLVPLKPPFKLTAADIYPFINKKTKILLINLPNNPTGAVIEKSELEKIAKLAVEKDFVLISDEIYEKIIYDTKNFSIASLNKEIRNRVITINGFSKTYAMTGWRIGYAAGPKEMIDAMILIQSQVTSATSSISQKAALGALTSRHNEVKLMLKEFKKRRDYISKELSQAEGFQVIPPEGAFYFFIGVHKLLKKGTSSQDWCMKLLDKEKVAVIPGEAFEAPGFIRLSFTVKFEDIKEGIGRIKRFAKI